MVSGSDDILIDDWQSSLLSHKQKRDHEKNSECMCILRQVENQTIVYPEEMSQKAKDFIDKLIRKNPHERIKANEALLHPFLAEADMDL